MKIVTDTAITTGKRKRVQSSVTRETKWVPDDNSAYCVGGVFFFVRSGNFTKSDCPNGNGSTLTYYKAYYSTLSQDDANAQSAADSSFTAEGQVYANENGTCIITL